MTDDDVSFIGMRPGENSSSRPSELSERGGRGRGISRQSRGNIRSKQFIQAQTHPIQGTRRLCWHNYETRNTKFCEDYMSPLLNGSQDTAVSIITALQTWRPRNRFDSLSA
jgi:hypothetical protein